MSKDSARSTGHVGHFFSKKYCVACKKMPTPISGRLLATPISGRGGCLGPPGNLRFLPVDF